MDSEASDRLSMLGARAGPGANVFRAARLPVHSSEFAGPFTSVPTLMSCPPLSYGMRVGLHARLVLDFPSGYHLSGRLHPIINPAEGRLIPETATPTYPIPPATHDFHG